MRPWIAKLTLSALLSVVLFTLALYGVVALIGDETMAPLSVAAPGASEDPAEPRSLAETPATTSTNEVDEDEAASEGLLAGSETPSLYGRITDTDGAAIAGVQVAALRAGGSDGLGAFIPPGVRSRGVLGSLNSLRAHIARQTSEIPATTSSAEGRFAFDDLAAGHYRVIARHPDYVANGGTRVVVPPGGSSQVDIELASGHVVKGGIVDGEGNPVRMARIESRRGGVRKPVGLARALKVVDDIRSGVAPVDAAAARSGPDGRFVVRGLARMSYDLTVRAPGFVPELQPGIAAERATETDTDATGELVITLRRGLALTGRVVDSRDEAVTGLLVHVAPASLEAHTSPAALLSADVDVLGDADIEAETEEDGVFFVGGLATRHYVVTITSPEHLSSRTKVRVAEDTYDLGDIVLQRGKSIDGIVRYPDGRLAPAARVWAEPAFDGDRAEAVTDAEGRFRFELVPDGVYTVRARTAGFVEGRVGAVPAGSIDVEVNLALGHELGGRVLDATSRLPLEGVNVELLGVGDSGSPRPVLFSKRSPSHCGCEGRREKSGPDRHHRCWPHVRPTVDVVKIDCGGGRRISQKTPILVTESDDSQCHQSGTKQSYQWDRKLRAERWFLILRGCDTFDTQQPDPLSACLVNFANRHKKL